MWHRGYRVNMGCRCGRLTPCYSHVSIHRCRTCASASSPRTVRLSVWRRCCGQTSSRRSESRRRSSCSSGPPALSGPSLSGRSRVWLLLPQEAVLVPPPHAGTGLKARQLTFYQAESQSRTRRTFLLMDRCLYATYPVARGSRVTGLYSDRCRTPGGLSGRAPDSCTGVAGPRS